MELPGRELEGNGAGEGQGAGSDGWFGAFPCLVSPLSVLTLSPSREQRGGCAALLPRLSLSCCGGFLGAAAIPGLGGGTGGVSASLSPPSVPDGRFSPRRGGRVSRCPVRRCVCACGGRLQLGKAGVPWLLMWGGDG